jgi:DNA polymerase elongation subunit (family B)
MIKNGECPEPFNMFSKEDKMKFKGALVLETKPGFYHNVVMVDSSQK